MEQDVEMSKKSNSSEIEKPPDIMPEMRKIVKKVRKSFKKGKTLDIEFRITQLNNLMKMFCEQEDAMLEALRVDFGRHKQESLIFEINLMKNELKTMQFNIREWIKPIKPGKSFINFYDYVLIHREPYGVVLIISAYSYPLQLVFVPLCAAIAAGNCVIIKPSNKPLTCEKFIIETIPKYLDNDCYSVISGDEDKTAKLLEIKFDYIFFTGTTEVGKLVHLAANKYLTPVTLELGGKCPCYIDDTIDIEIAVHRILWGKCVNAGQSCIAPDYILCTLDVQNKFIEIAKSVIDEFYGQETINSSPYYSKIINNNTFDRLTKQMKNGQTVIGGDYDINKLFIHPTILTDVQPNDSIMQEEIHGPILPIILIECAHQAIKFINARDAPLVLYVFSRNQDTHDSFIKKVHAGSICINDTLSQLTIDNLPFGGFGLSGMGKYRGKYSFDLFTHLKPCLIRDSSTFTETVISLRYPPYSDEKADLLTRLTRKRKGLTKRFFKNICSFIVGLAITLATYYALGKVF